MATATNEDGANGGLSSARHLMIAFTFGLSIFALVYVFATVSMANINPAVTLMLSITQKLSPLRAVLYIVAQVTGAIAGTAVVDSWNDDTSVAGACNYRMMTAQGHMYSKSAAFSVEVFTTMILLLAVSSATDDRQSTKMAGGKHISGLGRWCECSCRVHVH